MTPTIAEKMSKDRQSKIQGHLFEQQSKTKAKCSSVDPALTYQSHAKDDKSEHDRIILKMTVIDQHKRQIECSRHKHISLCAPFGSKIDGGKV